MTLTFLNGRNEVTFAEVNYFAIFIENVLFQSFLVKFNKKQS